MYGVIDVVRTWQPHGSEDARWVDTMQYFLVLPLQPAPDQSRRRADYEILHMKLTEPAASHVHPTAHWRREFADHDTDSGRVQGICVQDKEWFAVCDTLDGRSARIVGQSGI